MLHYHLQAVLSFTKFHSSAFDIQVFESIRRTRWIIGTLHEDQYLQCYLVFFRPCLRTRTSGDEDLCQDLFICFIKYFLCLFCSAWCVVLVDFCLTSWAQAVFVFSPFLDLSFLRRLIWPSYQVVSWFLLLIVRLSLSIPFGLDIYTLTLIRDLTFFLRTL